MPAAAVSGILPELCSKREPGVRGETFLSRGLYNVGRTFCDYKIIAVFQMSSEPVTAIKAGFIRLDIEENSLSVALHANIKTVNHAARCILAFGD